MMVRRCLITFLAAVGFSLFVFADEPAQLPLDIPNAWHVKLYRGNRQSGVAIDLNETGEVIETIQLRNRSEKTTIRKLDASQAVKGLHLTWSALEDAPLLSGGVSDGDNVQFEIVTKNWSWMNSWFTDGKFAGIDDRFETFVKYTKGEEIGKDEFRTKHLSAMELKERWQAELKKPNLNFSTKGYVRGIGFLERGDDKFGFDIEQFIVLAGIPVSENEVGRRMALLSEMRELFTDREPTGTMQVSYRLFCYENSTTITLKGLKSCSEIGPISTSLFTQGEKALDQKKKAP